MSAQNGSDYELLTEHFGYSPISLLDDIINTINVLADRALDSVERLLLSIPPQKLGFGLGFGVRKRRHGANKNNNNGGETPEETARREIENGTHQLQTLLNASIDKNFDLFELYTMRNILIVRPQDRPYMRLGHYDGLDLSSVFSRQQQQQDSDCPTLESVTALRRRLQASQRLHAALEVERLHNDELLRKLRALLGVKQTPGDAEAKQEDDEAAEGQADAKASPFAFLHDKGNLTESDSHKPITTTTEFALSQLAALRSLSTSLRTLLPEVGPGSASARAKDDAGADDDDDDDDDNTAPTNKSWRRERAEYVESSSRKYLERVGGLELDPLGEMRDGEWQGAGGRLAREEIEGLESVAIGMLGSHGVDDADDGRSSRRSRRSRRGPPSQTGEATTSTTTSTIRTRRSRASRAEPEPEPMHES
ncbi:hypothetical protein HIM_12698 [Hirsutella minnesotensis 3608]|uniref:Kinetochore-associated protein MTW1 n=1 Tax=Hirsutella minnesotensis 3608 TaxID=1043627 RepID=A0A0F7ZQI3_9HYPO|nr:hypothetical protein HIM_12698 [Hirsutella minnesotensis 3608]